jgi:organic radical activating enzyme
MESFYTIQGEGFNTGKAAYFIRLGGCDVGCHWCDVKESWDVKAHPLKTIEEIIADIKNYSCDNVVITGGEPLMHNLDILCLALKQSGYQTWLETSGAYALSGSWDWVCVSPKKFKAPLKSVIQKADELKVIVFNQSDFEFAEKHALEVSTNCRLFLQPEWGKESEILPFIIKHVKENPQWRISLQTHKHMNIP